jgi:hypothetical protein
LLAVQGIALPRAVLGWVLFQVCVVRGESCAQPERRLSCGVDVDARGGGSRANGGKRILGKTMVRGLVATLLAGTASASCAYAS